VDDLVLERERVAGAVVGFESGLWRARGYDESCVFPGVACTLLTSFLSFFYFVFLVVLVLLFLFLILVFLVLLLFILFWYGLVWFGASGLYDMILSSFSLYLCVVVCFFFTPCLLPLSAHLSHHSHQALNKHQTPNPCMAWPIPLFSSAILFLLFLSLLPALHSFLVSCLMPHLI
jgi:hypothetical protein